MAHEMLFDFIEATAARFGVPGVAVGLWVDGQEVYAVSARLARHYLPQMMRAGWGRILRSAGMTCSYTPGDPAVAQAMIAWLTCKAALPGLARGLAEIAAGSPISWPRCHSPRWSIVGSHERRSN